MNAWHINPVGALAQLRGEVDRMMGDVFSPVAHALPRAWAGVRAFPAVNVWEEGEELRAEAELPGLKTDDVEISVVGSELTLRGRRRDSATGATAYHRHERGTGEFTRTLRLPYEVDPSGVEATLTDGVLSLRLPKAASARPRKIEVRSGK